MIRNVLLLISIFMSISIYGQTIDITNGLISYYPFNCNAKDVHGNNDGIIHDAQLTTDRFGNKDSAYEFDGVDDFIDLGDKPDFQFRSDFSFSLWIYYSGEKQLATLLGKRRGTRPWNMITLSFIDNPTSSRPNATDYLSLFIRHDNNLNDKVITANSYPLSKGWHHIVICNEANGTASLYINGDLIKSSQSSQGNTFVKGYPLYIGRNSGEGALASFKGKIDDVRIYDKVLNQKEIEFLSKEQDFSPKEKIDFYVSNKMKKWSQKDEYETSAEYDKRIKLQSREKEEIYRREILNKITQKIDWSCGMKEYNADKEIFILKFRDLELFQIQVPKDEARDFGNNFDNIEYINPILKLSDKPNLIVERLEIRNPINEKIYKYYIDKQILDKDGILVKSKIVTVKIWDDAQEDGDIVQCKSDCRIKPLFYSF